MTRVKPWVGYAALCLAAALAQRWLLASSCLPKSG